MTIKIYSPKTGELEESKLVYLCQLVNDVYNNEECLLINPKIQRISLDDLKGMINNGLLIVAELNKLIIGCIRLVLVDKTTVKFGMLVSHPDFRFRGLGKKLIFTVESWAKNNGYQYICLELLSPKSWIHEQKGFLKNWYQRLGYLKKHEVDFEKKDFLITPCDFILYCKKLI